MQNNENSSVNPNDAPEGFIAVETTKLLEDGTALCDGCYFVCDAHCIGYLQGHRCTRLTRLDKRNVIFIKKQDNKATLFYPCGSLGEEIE